MARIGIACIALVGLMLAACGETAENGEPDGTIPIADAADAATANVVDGEFGDSTGDLPKPDSMSDVADAAGSSDLPSRPDDLAADNWDSNDIKALADGGGEDKQLFDVAYDELDAFPVELPQDAINCTPGQPSGNCLGPASYAVCNESGDGWTTAYCDAPTSCYQGKCVDYACPPGQTVCKGMSKVQECIVDEESGTAKWVVVEDCGEFPCADGECTQGG